MSSMIGVCVFLIGVSALITKLFCYAAQNSRLMDKPNERSSHTVPKVRGGGLVFISLSLGVLPFLAYATQTPFYTVAGFIVCSALIAFISLMDDIYNLSAKVRFITQLLVSVALLVILKPNYLDFIWFGVSNKIFLIPFLILSIIWAINHFNFMDGLDGFCALQSIFLFFSYALLFHFVNATMFEGFCWVMVSNLLGFLIFNFPPARLFMGDIGSATLGFISFYIALVAQQKFQIPILYWFILNGLFLFDSTITLLRRIAKKEKWYSPHKKHAYQRLHQLGISSPLILWGQLFMNAFFLLLVILLQFQVFNVFWVILLSLGLMISVYLCIEKHHPMYNLPQS